MFLLRAPTADDIHHYLQRVRREELTYPAIGCTEEPHAPCGYLRDHSSVRLGQGNATFQAACRAVREWRVYPESMVTLYWPSARWELGTNLIVGLRLGMLWSLNPCRVVHTIGDTRAHRGQHVQRCGFTVGTLPGHVAAGEERFLVTWNRHTDEVAFQIDCVSRAQQSVAWIGWPYLRMQQARFRRLALQAMQQATGAPRRQRLASESHVA